MDGKFAVPRLILSLEERLSEEVEVEDLADSIQETVVDKAGLLSALHYEIQQLAVHNLIPIRTAPDHHAMDIARLRFHSLGSEVTFYST